MTLNTSAIKASSAVWIIYLLALFLPIQSYLPLGNFPLSTSYILIGISFLCLLTSKLILRNLSFYIPSTFRPISLLSFAIIFYSFSAFDWRASLMSGVQVFAYFILFFTVSNALVTEKHILATIKFLLIGSIINSFLGVIQVLLGTIRPDMLFYCLEKFI